MSHQLISRSPDLKRLRDEGYDISVQSNYLVARHIPYVNSQREVKQGILVSELTLAGNETSKPSTHVIQFQGDLPCNKDGKPLTQIIHQSSRTQLDTDLTVDHSFSSKPKNGYADYYEKITTYAAIVSSPAQSIDSQATTTPYLPVEADQDESVFAYLDTSSSRAEINAVTRKLELDRVAIIGLGGTGSYILDFVAKTPVKEIVIADGDVYSQHNAFRSPGAASIDQLRERPSKVDYFANIYSNMHRNITPLHMYIDETNIDQVAEVDFVFICVDRGSSKRLIVDYLETKGIQFIDVGMGVNVADDSLCGVLRVTTSSNDKLQQSQIRKRIPMSDAEADNEYSQNIQIADLNGLNAAFAVVKWKKLYGFYKDFDHEHNTTYTIDGNDLDNEDKHVA